MNNMQKSFKRKSALRCMADGGAIYKSVGANGVPIFSDVASSGDPYVPGEQTPSLAPAPAPAPPPAARISPALPPPAAKISPLAIGPKSNYMANTGGFGPTPAPGGNSTYLKAGGAGTIGSTPSSIGANRAEIGAGRAPIGAGSPPIGSMSAPIGANRAEIGARRQPIGAMGYPLMTTMASGGKVTGPGGPTEDKVPAMLSAGEYVLPADTVKKVGVQNLDALKDATHTPVGPKSKLRGNVRKYPAGGFVLPQTAEDIRRAALEAQNRVQKGLPAPGDRWGRQPQTTVNTPTRTPVVQPAPVLDKSFQTPGAQRAAVVANAPSGYSAPKPLTPTITAGRGTVPPGGPQMPAARVPIQAAVGARQAAQQSAIGAQIDARLAAKPVAVPAPAAAAPVAQATQAAAKPGLVARAGSALAGWGKGLVGGAAKLATPVVATYGATQAIGDNSNGYADYRDDGGGVSGHTGRVLETLGNAFTGGYAEKLVQGVGATLEGDDFSAGWNLPTRRDEYLANRRDPITNALPSASGEAGYSADKAAPAPAPAPGTTPALPEGVTQGQDFFRQGMNFTNKVDANGQPLFDKAPDGPSAGTAATQVPKPGAKQLNSKYYQDSNGAVIEGQVPMITVPGTPGTDDNAARAGVMSRTPEMQFGPVPSGPGSSLRSGRGGGMRLNMPSASSGINARFDKMVADYTKNANWGLSPSKTARTLADIEQARTNALNGVMGNDTTRRGQDMAASSAAARDAAGLEQEGMRGQFALLSGQAAANLAAQKAQTDQELKFTEEDRANFDQMYGDSPDKGEAYATYAANKHLLPQGIEGVQQAGAMLGMLKAAGLAPGTRIEAFGANPVTGGAGSEESDQGTRYDAAGGGLRGIGAALNPADLLGDDNYYTIHTKAGPKKVARRSLRGGDSQMQTWQELLGRNIKE